jgi:hypothetical protein
MRAKKILGVIVSLLVSVSVQAQTEIAKEPFYFSHYGCHGSFRDYCLKSLIRKPFVT